MLFSLLLSSSGSEQVRDTKLKHCFLDVNLSKTETYFKMHNLFSGLFHGISPGAYYSDEFQLNFTHVLYHNFNSVICARRDIVAINFSICYLCLLYIDAKLLS